ncbi:MAG: endolytic transglycosylase MltG [bacterium]|nr:endolytic transglycosylase MltG [bacterium]
MTDHSNNGLPPGTPPSSVPQQHDWQVPPHSHAQEPGYQPISEPQHFEPVITQPKPQQGLLKTKKKRNRTLKLMQLLMSLSFFAAIGVAGFYMFTHLQIDKPGPLTREVLFEVGKGQGLSVISSRLQKNGIISNRRIFALHVVASKSAKKLKAGKYAIPQAASMQDVLNILVRGKAIFYQVTLPEGWTSEQVVNALKAHPQLAGSIDAIPPEGSLMPDTFQFSEGANRRELLVTMAAAQEKYLKKLWPTRQDNLPFKTAKEALILASIVEKETGRSSERKRVAGVFVNRLRKGMKLQSDPTIIYGLVGGKGKLGHPLRRSEMAKKTGYNTYQIKGLPPTPIANPGRKAIEAVLNPADTKDLYFVADGTGGHAFAPNIKSHNNNVRKWRKIEAKRRVEKKRKQAEEARLTALEQKQKPPAKEIEKAIPGVAVNTEAPAQAKSTNGWGNNIPLPARKPH